MQSYISHHRGRVFNPPFFSFLSLSCFIDLLQKISETIEKMIFSLIFVLPKIYFRQMQKITKISYLRSAFLRKCCFSCSVKKASRFALFVRSTYSAEGINSVYGGRVIDGD